MGVDLIIKSYQHWTFIFQVCPYMTEIVFCSTKGETAMIARSSQLKPFNNHTNLLITGDHEQNSFQSNTHWGMEGDVWEINIKNKK